MLPGQMNVANILLADNASTLPQEMKGAETTVVGATSTFNIPISKRSVRDVLISEMTHGFVPIFLIPTNARWDGNAKIISPANVFEIKKEKAMDPKRPVKSTVTRLMLNPNTDVTPPNTYALNVIPKNNLRGALKTELEHVIIAKHQPK